MSRAIQQMIPRYSRAIANRCRRVVMLPYRRATSHLRTMPSFLIIGVQKGGTTSLLDYLCRQPHVVPAFIKEPHFFDLNFSKGPKWYRSFFPLRSHMKHLEKANSGSNVHTGEASPYYIYHPKAARRVTELLSDVKVIVALRDPTERAFSHYRHNVRKGREKRAFSQAVSEELAMGPKRCDELRRCSSAEDYDVRHFNYLGRGLYYYQLEDWYERLGSEQILVIRSEDFFNGNSAALARVCSFLGIEGSPTAPHANAGIPGEWGARLRSQIREFYSEPNQELSRNLGITF